MLKILTGTDCPNCETCKTLIKEKNIDIEQIFVDPSEREGRDLQMQYRVMGAPTILEFDWDKEIDRFVWMDAVDYLSNL